MSAIIRLKALEEVRLREDKIPLETDFEKGMESYLGVEQRVVRQNEDVEEMERKKERRKRAFYGIEFVPLDQEASTSESTEEAKKGAAGRAKKDKGSSRKYSEDQEPSTARVRKVFFSFLLRLMSLLPSANDGSGWTASAFTILHRSRSRQGPLGLP